jgi:hypothetical protein
MDLLALDAALERLADRDPQKARLVGLRYFAGLTDDKAAAVLGISPAAPIGSRPTRGPGSGANSASARAPDARLSERAQNS